MTLSTLMIKINAHARQLLSLFVYLLTSNSILNTVSDAAQTGFCYLPLKSDEVF